MRIIWYPELLFYILRKFFDDACGEIEDAYIIRTMQGYVLRLKRYVISTILS